MMKQSIKVIGWLAACMLLFSGTQVFAATPMELLKDTQKKIETLLDKDIPKSDKKALRKREKQIRNILKPYFDFRMLASRTLAKHWKKLTDDQKNEFVFWLRELLESAYVRGVRSGARDKTKPEVLYKKEEVKDGKAKVFTIVRYLKKRRRRRRRKRWKKIHVDWKFELKAKQWKVADILTNDNSLIDTYREQFDKIIQKKSYKELLKRIKKKVNQLRKGKGLNKLEYKKAGKPKPPARRE
jgi:phospholipid transport system substrate-binding protein